MKAYVLPMTDWPGPEAAMTARRLILRDWEAEAWHARRAHRIGRE